MFHKNSSEIFSGYFGKLPEFNDFIKLNAGSLEILHIDTWLQEGLAQAKLKFKEDWKEKYSSVPPTRFFIPVPSSQKIVAGMLYPGNDKSGRDFPFIIFSLIAGKLFDPFHLLVAILENNISALDEILKREETQYSLNTAIKNHQVTLPVKDQVNNNYMQYLSNTHINEFLARTGLSSLKEKVKGLTFQDNSVIYISFTADDLNFTYDAGFLIHILQNKINLSTKHTSVFWSAKTEGQHQVFIFPFKLTALNFADLLSPDNISERMIRIDGSTGESESPEDSNFTLEEFLKTF